MSDVNLEVNRTTKGSAPTNLNVEIKVNPAPEVRRVEHGHRQPRFFLGPMPERIAAAPIVEVSKSPGLGKRLGLGLRKRIPSTSLRRSISSHESISRDRALTFFLSKGGKEEEFNEGDVKAEMLRRIRSSRWFKEDKDGNKVVASTSNNWIGDSFEIGKDVLGLSTLAEPDEVASQRSRVGSPDIHAESLGSLRAISPPLPRTTSPDKTSVGIKSSIIRPPVEDSAHSKIAATSITGDSPPSKVSSPGEPGSSQTRLLVPNDLQLSRAHTDGKLLAPARSKPLAGGNSILSAPAAEVKGKGKARVTFPDNPGKPRTLSDAGAGIVEEPEPVSPGDVLAREPALTTSAGAAARVQDELEPVDDDNVLIRDRMLVRVLTTNSAVQRYMDEKQLLEMPEARKERATMWREYLVVWKTSYIELYEPHAVLTKEWMTKQMHLAFKIPLLPSKTTVSIFSNVDMSFCVTCPKLSAHSHLPTHLFNREDKQTTMIFILKLKTRSRAVDWTWRLWRKLGGEIPDFVEFDAQLWMLE